MITRFLRFGFLLALALVLVACAETPQITRTPVKLRLAEAADQAAVLNRVVKDYTADREWVSAGTTSLAQQDAVARVRNSQLDAAILHAKPEKTAGVWISGLAHDPIAIIVHPTNPIGDVTLAQLSDLFQGRTFDWTPFGGTGEVIPVSREAEAYSRQVFEERVMQARAVTRNAVLKSSATDVIGFVANTPGAIGYVPTSHLDERVKAIAIEGVAPSAATAANGKYVLSSPLYVIAQSEPQGDLREFIAWLLGDPGQTLLSQSGLGRVR
ncbi:Phosphate-binding protein PstS 1 [Thermoflexales bacterium]|nr:Phosphate-binding protein PstS 1 [Thermoflexales bacterium]